MAARSKTRDVVAKKNDPMDIQIESYYHQKVVEFLTAHNRELTTMTIHTDYNTKLLRKISVPEFLEMIYKNPSDEEVVDYGQVSCADNTSAHAILDDDVPWIPKAYAFENKKQGLWLQNRFMEVHKFANGEILMGLGDCLRELFGDYFTSAYCYKSLDRLNYLEDSMPELEEGRHFPSKWAKSSINMCYLIVESGFLGKFDADKRDILLLWIEAVKAMCYWLSKGVELRTRKSKPKYLDMIKELEPINKTLRDRIERVKKALDKYIPSSEKMINLAMSNLSISEKRPPPKSTIYVHFA